MVLEGVGGLTDFERGGRGGFDHPNEQKHSSGTPSRGRGLFGASGYLDLIVELGDFGDLAVGFDCDGAAVGEWVVGEVEFDGGGLGQEVGGGWEWRDGRGGDRFAGAVADGEFCPS